MAILNSTVIPYLEAGGGPGPGVDREQTFITSNQNTEIDTSASKSGSSSILMNSSSNWIDTDLNILAYAGSQTTDFTIEAWLYPTVQQTGINRGVFEHIGSGDYNTRMFMHLHNSSGLRVYYKGITVGYVTWNDLGGTITNAWHHVAFVLKYTGSTGIGSLYWNGELKNSATVGILAQNSSSYLRIGSLIGSNQPWGGNMDMFRVSKVARYTGNFTPPTSMTNDEDTMLLLQFEGADGDTSISSSGYLDDYQ